LSCTSPPSPPTPSLRTPLPLPLSYTSLFFFNSSRPPPALPSSPTRRSSDLPHRATFGRPQARARSGRGSPRRDTGIGLRAGRQRSEEHTSELQSLTNLVCRLLLEKKKKTTKTPSTTATCTAPISPPCKTPDTCAEARLDSHRHAPS